MITKIVLNAFQSHENSELLLHPGVNVIIGKSDSGKSAIFRAVNWVRTNRPTGDAFRSSFGGTTKCSLFLNEIEVSRIKDKSTNEYHLNDEVFTALGTSVPEEVEKALNLEEINMQSQFDRPFLLDSSPGEIANHFNRLANIEKINESLGTIRKKMHALDSSITGQREHIKEVKEKLTSFIDLSQLEMQVEVLEQDESNKNQLSSKIGILSKLIESFIDVALKLEEGKTLTMLEKEVNRILKWKEEVTTQQQKIDELTECLFDYTEVSQRINKYSVFLTQVPEIEKISNLIEQRNIKKDKENELVQLIEDYVSYAMKISKRSKEITDEQKHFIDEMPETCPLCGSNLAKHNEH